MAAADDGGLFDGVRERIRAALRDDGVPSMAVAVARDGEILWEEGFGWADRERRVPATEHTPYSLASISKPLTATAVLLLKERGKLELDAPVNRYLAADAQLVARAGGDADGATVRRVADHTSGLPLHYQFFYEDEPARRPPMDETIRRYGNLVAPPGDRYEYSNLGYGVLDHVVARLSGIGYADFMRREVFLPLGMTRSSVDIAPGLAPYAAARYGPDGVAYPFYDFDHPGGSAAYCSAHDLLLFGMLHSGQRLLPDQKVVLSDDAVAEMQAHEPKTGGETTGYAFGWGFNDDQFGYRSVSHGGGMPGVSTLLMLLPAERIAAVVLANARCPLAYRLHEEIFAALLPDYAAKRAEAKEAEKAKETEKPKAVEAFAPPPPGLLGEWKGTVRTYAGDVPLTLHFKDGGDVHAQVGDQLKTLVNGVTYKDDRLRGKLLGDGGTEDARRRPHHLHADLTLRGETLTGALVAVSTTPDGEGAGAPARRGAFALSHPATLTRP